MDRQITSKGGLASNLWLQMAVLAVAAVVLIAFAAKYLW
jgi:hypothetical protein